MNELIQIVEKNGEKLVNAEEVHNFLQVKTAYTTWIQRRIEQMGLIKDRDFVELAGGRANRKDFIVPVDVAKHLAMTQLNEKGRQLREYFIEVEKNSSKVVSGADNTPVVIPQTQAQLIAAQAQILVEMEQKQIETNNRLEDLEARARFSTDTGFYSVSGYAAKHGIHLPLSLAKKVGKRASQLSKQYGLQTGEVPCERFGSVKSYHAALLKEAFDDVN